MRAGPRRHYFTLFEPSETGGDAVVTYDPRGTAWGSLRSNGGSKQSALDAEASYTVGLPVLPSLTGTRVPFGPLWQLGLGTRRFAITSGPLDPDGRNRETQVQAVELTV